MRLKAFLSRRVVTPHGIKAAAVLIQHGRILDVVSPHQLPTQICTADFGEAAILPGLVDSHVHINEPGRTEWEGFRTATRAAAAGGCTLQPPQLAAARCSWTCHSTVCRQRRRSLRSKRNAR